MIRDETDARYNRNMEVLKHRFPRVALAVKNAPDIVELAPSRTGPLTGRYGKTTLHSFHDPVAEGAKFAASQGLTDGSQAALFGVGLGYHLAPLLDAVGATGKVVAAEANASILKAAMRALDDLRVIEDPRLFFICASSEDEFLSELSSAYSALDSARTKTVIFNPSFQLIPPDFTKTRTAIEMVRMERRFPLLMGGKEAENLRENISRLRSAKGVNALKGTARGRGVFIVGAGPSLERDVTALTANHGCLIISADTALPALLTAGVEPHFVVTADPQADSLHHFTLAGRFDLPLILTPTASPEIVRRWTGPLYAGFINSAGLEGEARAMAERMGFFHSGGTVSALALETAALMEASHVTLIGQDFCWPRGVCYAAETFPCLAGARPMDDSAVIYDMNVSGEPVATTVALHSYRRSFEEVIQSTGARVFTMSAWGLAVRGVTVISSPLETTAGYHSP